MGIPEVWVKGKADVRCLSWISGDFSVANGL